MKVGSNPRGPSRKAKYSLATDSEPVARAKDGKNPYQGRIVNLKPHAYKRSEGYAGLPECLTACLLHNDPATYGYQQVKRLCRGARAKASLKKANKSVAVDAKPRELHMGRMKWG